MHGPTPPTAPRVRIFPWWAWVAAVSLVFIHATLPWFQWLAPHWPRGYAVLQHIRPWLNLGVENNLGVWWSAALLFLGAMLLLELAADVPEARGPFAALGVLSLSLCLDEVASVHERLSDVWGWLPLIPIGIAAGALLAWALWSLAGRLGRRVTAGLVLVGYLCYGSVVLQEMVEHRELGSWTWHSGRFEEGAELLGSILVLLAAVRERTRRREPRLRAVIPRPDRLPGVRGVLTAGLVLHALAAVLVVPRLPDWEWRGNPATFYPAAAYGLAACAAFWQAQAVPGPARRRRAAWTATAAVLLVASIGAIFDLVALFPGIDRLLPRWSYYGFHASYFFLVPALLLPALAGGLVSRLAPLLVAIALPLAAHSLTGSWRVTVVTPGFLAWAFAMAYGVGRKTAVESVARAPAARKWLAGQA